jgi:hypothetical protein
MIVSLLVQFVKFPYFILLKNAQGLVVFILLSQFVNFFNIILEVFVSIIHSAICPYLALETCRQWHLSNRTIALMRTGTMPTMTVEQAQQKFQKVMSQTFVALRWVDLGTSYRVCH